MGRRFMSSRKKLPPGVPRQSDCVLVYTIEHEYILQETGKIVVLMPHQRRILNHVFTVQKTPNAGMMPYRTAIYSATKKSAKTETSAMVAYAWARQNGGEILFIANDKQQVQERAFGRLVNMLLRMKAKYPDRYEKVVISDPTAELIKLRTMKGEESRIRAIPCDPYGEAGGHQSLTLWDELWGYRQDRATLLWSELQPVPTVKKSMRFVTTYAGWFGVSELLWSLYEYGVQPNMESDMEPRGERVPGLEDLPCFRNGSMFVYWDHECRCPWQTEKFLQEARNDPATRMRKSEYLRLWENRWTTGEEAFIDMDQIEKLMGMGERAGLINHMRGMFR